MLNKFVVVVVVVVVVVKEIQTYSGTELGAWNGWADQSADSCFYGNVTPK